MSEHDQKQDEIGRKGAVGSLATDSLEEQAIYLIGYYQDLCNLPITETNPNNECWLLGLYMAKQWLHYLNEPQHNMDELRLFVRALESQRLNHGSGWVDLWMRVRNWVASIEQGSTDRLKCP